MRIAIIGNTAGGKSTLARHLAAQTGIDHVEIDGLYWQPGWLVTPGDIYQRKHAEAMAADSWIMDGGGDLPSMRARMDRATDIILIDLPLWVHFARAAERQIAWATGTLDHPPAGGGEMPPTGRLFEIIWQLDQDWMPVLRQICDAQEAAGKRVTRLTSIEALDNYMRGS